MAIPVPTRSGCDFVVSRLRRAERPPGDEGSSSLGAGTATGPDSTLDVTKPRTTTRMTCSHEFTNRSETFGNVIGSARNVRCRINASSSATRIGIQIAVTSSNRNDAATPHELPVGVIRGVPIHEGEQHQTAADETDGRRIEEQFPGCGEAELFLNAPDDDGTAGHRRVDAHQACDPADHTRERRWQFMRSGGEEFVGDQDQRLGQQDRPGDHGTLSNVARPAPWNRNKLQEQADADQQRNRLLGEGHQPNRREREEQGEHLLPPAGPPNGHADQENDTATRMTTVHAIG